LKYYAIKTNVNRLIYEGRKGWSMKEVLERLFEDDYDNFKSYLLGRFSSLSNYDVEDIISKTFIKLLSTGSKNKYSIINLQSYFYGSLKNGALDYIKSTNKEVQDVEFLEIDYNTPERILLNQELKKIIAMAIDNLDPKSKFIFVSSEIVGKSFKEISNETGIKIGSLLSRKSRAKKKLREYLLTYLMEENKDV